MRVRIVFELQNKGTSVPFHHQYLISSLIREIAGTSSEYAEFLDYNFSGLKGQTKVGKDGLHFFSSKVTLVFASPNEEFIKYVLREMFAREEVDVGQLRLKPLFVEKEYIPQLKGPIKYICISPILLANPLGEDGDPKRFVNPSDDSFSDLLYESTMIRMENSGRYTPEQIESFYKFQLVPDKKYLTKIQQTQKKFSRIYPIYENDIKFEVRGYTLPFTLYAADEVQEFVFHSGLGELTHKGFGMLDIANTDPAERAEVYEFDKE